MQTIAGFKCVIGSPTKRVVQPLRGSYNTALHANNADDVNEVIHEKRRTLRTDSLLCMTLQAS